MFERHTFTGVVAVAVSILVAAPAFASTSNNYAVMGRTDLSGVTRVQGTQNIRTDPAVPQNGDGSYKDVTFAHIFQSYFPNGDFYAIGTYKGDAIDSNCGSDYDAKWSTYVDGKISGVYFCNMKQRNAYSAGAQPYFKLILGTCSNGFAGWQAFDSGTQVDCRSSLHDSGQGGGFGLEVVGNATVLANNTFNIDVKHKDLQLYRNGSWIDLNANQTQLDSRYNVASPSAQRVNSWQGTLD